MSGAKHRQKGNRIERELVHRHRAIGVDAERVPLSGAAGGNYTGDVVVRLQSREVGPLLLRGEVKARANGEGFATLERWLGKNDVLFLRRDRSDPMVLVPWEVWARLVIRAQDREEMNRVLEAEREGVSHAG